jgi:hypothetical protein
LNKRVCGRHGLIVDDELVAAAPNLFLLSYEGLEVDPPEGEHRRHVGIAHGQLSEKARGSEKIVFDNVAQVQNNGKSFRVKITL